MRLLIAYDGADGLEAVSDDLGRAGLPEECDAVVLSVVDAWLPSDEALAEGSPPIASQHHETLQRVDERLQRAQAAADSLRQRFPKWRITPESYADSPGWGIIRRAEGWSDQWKADLIVLGATEKKRIERWLLGSVSHQVLTFARCSVRVARPREVAAAEPVQLIAGVDGSPNSDAAIQALCRRNWPEGTSVRLVCVLDSKMVPATVVEMRGFTSTTRAAEAIIDRASRELCDAGLQVSAQIADGDPKRELVAEAERLHADAVFLGARGLTRIERILLGSVSLAVSMRAPCSVEVVRILDV